jgi:hypothetical protein
MLAARGIIVSHESVRGPSSAYCESCCKVSGALSDPEARKEHCKAAGQQPVRAAMSILALKIAQSEPH